MALEEETQLNENRENSDLIDNVTKLVNRTIIRGGSVYVKDDKGAEAKVLSASKLVGKEGYYFLLQYSDGSNSLQPVKLGNIRLYRWFNKVL